MNGTRISPSSCFGKAFHETYAVPKMVVHLVDGTYELFRHFYRVKGFASRGLVILFFQGVLCVRVAA